MNLVERVTFGKTAKNNLPEFKSGDTVSVSIRVKEGNKERLQIFKGIVIKVQGHGMGRSFTVRKMSSGIGVEKTFPVTSPNIESVKVESRGKVRRSRLYYLRALRGRAARLKSELVMAEKKVKPEVEAAAPTAAEQAEAPATETPAE